MTGQEAEALRRIYELYSQLFDIYKKEIPELLPNDLLQLSNIFILFNKVAIAGSQNPLKLISLQGDLTKDFIKMFNDFHIRVSTFRQHKDLFQSFKFDNRFANNIWYDNPYYELLKRLYYLVKKYSLRWLYSIDGIDNKTRQQLHFYIINFLNIFAPTNYILTNPEVMQACIETGGCNLLLGLQNYLEDLVLNSGKLNVRMTDTKAFTVGVNLANTPGKVIFQNKLIQLIQYTAATDHVYKTPILFVPPFINKYYILDLSQKNSLVKWLVDQGFTVFMISWINPNAELANTSFDDYMLDGPIQALNIITQTLKCDTVHFVGYCIGGTLLACALAYLMNINDTRVESATFLMTLLNFKSPGEIGVFLDDYQLSALEKVMKSRGFLNGRLLDLTFNTLRPNELIWPYFINSYLLGKPAKPFDLLYWNADSTNLPYKMYDFYLRTMYLHNKLRIPGAVTLADQPIDLGKINVPTFFLGAEKDHITLWRSIFSGLRLLGGPVEFVLSESGHVRAVANPPHQCKYGFKINQKYKTAEQFNDKANNWLQDATTSNESWWTYWLQWLKSINNEQVNARTINPEIIIEDAPGSYVKRKI